MDRAHMLSTTAPARFQSRSKWAPGVALVGVLALSACAPDDPAEFEEGETESASESQASAAGGDDNEVQVDSENEEPDETETEAPEENEEDLDSSEDSTSAVDESRHPDNAQQVVTYSLPGVDGEMAMGLQSLEAKEQGLLLSVSFVPDYDDDTEDGPLSMYDLHDPSGMAGHNAYLLPTLSDRENFKQYYVPTPETRDRTQGWQGRSTDAWATDLEGVGLTSGEVTSLWAYFPVPEDDIDVVDVAVVPGVQEFQNVEIDWGDVQPGGGAEDSESGSEEADADDASEDES